MAHIRGLRFLAIGFAILAIGYTASYTATEPISTVYLGNFEIEKAVYDFDKAIVAIERRDLCRKCSKRLDLNATYARQNQIGQPWRQTVDRTGPPLAIPWRGLAI